MVSHVTPLRFRHLGVAVAEINRALKTYEEIFGYRLLAGPFEDEIQKVTVCFVGTGLTDDVVIELVAPHPGGSPVDRFVARGGGAYHLCYEAHDFDTALDELRQKGCLSVGDPVPAVAFGGRRIAWLYTPSRDLIEILEA
jgi:methylmalonyl-CoA/ethylmalonyl-CoA epimerase